MITLRPVFDDDFTDDTSLSQVHKVQTIPTQAGLIMALLGLRTCQIMMKVRVKLMVPVISAISELSWVACDVVQGARCWVCCRKRLIAS